VVDVVGDLDTAIRSVRPGGMVAAIGVLGGTRAEISVPLVVMRQVTVQGVTCGSAEDFRDMLDVVAQGGLKPVISDVFAFRRVPDALAAMRDGAHFGKIVVEVS